MTSTGTWTTQTYPNGVAATFTYDATNRLMQRIDIGNGSQLLNLAYDRARATCSRLRTP